MFMPLMWIHVGRWPRYSWHILPPTPRMHRTFCREWHSDSNELGRTDKTSRSLDLGTRWGCVFCFRVVSFCTPFESPEPTGFEARREPENFVPRSCRESKPAKHVLHRSVQNCSRKAFIDGSEGVDWSEVAKGSREHDLVVPQVMRSVNEEDKYVNNLWNVTKYLLWSYVLLWHAAVCVA